MAKEISIFRKYVDRLMPKLSSLIEKVNDKRRDDRTYLHKDTSILKKEFAPDNKWEAKSVNTSYVAADFMAFDSPVDIKTRPTIAAANGKLPKAGIGRNLTESQLTELQVMEAQGGNDERVAKKIADDLVFCSVGLDELNEWALLYGLYNGFVGIPDIDHPQQLMRLNFNYLDENTFGTITKGAITLDDIDRVFSEASANNDTIEVVWISKSALKALRETRKARELVADADDRVYTDETSLKVPSESRFKEVFEGEYGVELMIVDRTIIFERNGVKAKTKPWGDDRIIFCCNKTVGSFVYGELAENRNRVAGVSYSLVDDYKLICRYSVNDPSLVEKTKGEEIAAPVIEDVDQIYVLDRTLSETMDTDAETADTEDNYITIWGHKYLKSEVTAAFAAQGIVPSGNTDAAYIAAINNLSNKKENALKDALVYYPVVTPSILEFAKTADSTGKTVAVDTNDSANAASATATTSDAWITPTISNKVVTVKVSANSETSAPARTGSVTVTVGDKTATITVKQAANS